MDGFERVTVAGRPLTCRHCGGDTFRKTSASLDRMALGGWFHLEGAGGHHVTIYVCGGCGLAEMFFPHHPEPPPLPDDAEPARRSAAVEDPVTPASAAEPIECLSCAAEIPPGAPRCDRCGWSWKPE